MTKLFQHLKRAFIFIGLVLSTFSMLSCGGGGGGGGGASAANNNLPVIRSYSGNVSNGTLILSDPLTGASVAVAGSGVPNGTAGSLSICKGTLPILGSRSAFLTASNTYELNLPLIQLASSSTITFTMPDLGTTPSIWRHCVLALSATDSTFVGLKVSPSGTPGFVNCTVPAGISRLSASASEGHLYATLLDYNQPPASMNVAKSISNPSLYLFNPVTQTNQLNSLGPAAISGKRICVLIHGLSQSATDPSIVAAAQHLYNQILTSPNGSGVRLYDYILVANYDSIFTSIKTNAESLSAQLAPFLGEASSCDIVGYSMGGLVARWAIEKAPTPLAPYSPRLITMATPHAGVPTDYIYQLADLLEIALGIPDPLGVQYYVPEGIAELGDSNSVTPLGYDFIGNLNSSPGSPNLDYYTLAGYGGVDESNGVFVPVEIAMDTLYHVLNPSDPRNDGIVGLYSAQWSGLSSKSSSWAQESNGQSIQTDQTHFDVIDNIVTGNGLTISPFLTKNVNVVIQKK